MLLRLLLFAGFAFAIPQFHGGFFPSGTSSASFAAPTSSGAPFANGGFDGNFPHNSPFPWAPAGPGDSRSPCPALNTLANHFLLPHDGRNITIPDLVTAFALGQNFAEDAIIGAAEGALALCANETGSNCTSFDLAMLDKPHEIEHDNSLSREDFNFGRDNNSVFSPMIWNQVLGVWHGATIIDYSLAKAARNERVTVANATDVPGWYVNASARTDGETSFYLSLFSTSEDPTDGLARKDWINVWFEQERFAFELGWTVTQREVITATILANMTAQLEAA